MEAGINKYKDAFVIKDLCLGYGNTTVIKKLSFCLEPGSVLAVMGPSGCGKTTLLNGLAGLIRPFGGSVLYHNRPLSPKTVSIGLVPQNYGLLPWKTVRQNCLYFGAIRKIKDPPRLTGLFNRLGIASLGNRYPAALSGGQAQRAALARAFYIRPSLLLMDEPFSALDYKSSCEAADLFLSVWKDFRPAALLITHSPEDALYVSGRIAVMGREGRFTRCYANPFQGIRRPASPEYDGILHSLRKDLTAC